MALDHAVSVPGTSSATMAAEQLAGEDYEDFFRSSPPPENLDSVRTAVRDFVMHQQACGAHHCKKLQNYSIASSMHAASEVQDPHSHMDTMQHVTSCDVGYTRMQWLRWCPANNNDLAMPLFENVLLDAIAKWLKAGVLVPMCTLNL